MVSLSCDDMFEYGQEFRQADRASLDLIVNGDDRSNRTCRNRVEVAPLTAVYNLEHLFHWSRVFQRIVATDAGARPERHESLGCLSYSFYAVDILMSRYASFTKSDIIFLAFTSHDLAPGDYLNVLEYFHQVFFELQDGQLAPFATGEVEESYLRFGVSLHDLALFQALVLILFRRPGFHGFCAA